MSVSSKGLGEAVLPRSGSGGTLLRMLAAASMAVVFVQVSTAGITMLVDPGFAGWHAWGGRLGSIVVVATALAGWIGNRDRGTRWSALLLLVAYHLQAVWLIAGQLEGLHWVRALHAPNALLVFHLAWRLYGRSSTRR